jgi:uncharacterized surface protein with fasciclin (FAS1) repeats
MMLAATMLTAASCSDFDDYNEVPASTLQADGQSLWENISQNPDLSDFRNLVQRTGFQNHLQEIRAYTVWAPKNGFDMTDYQAMSDSMLLAQFVKNHIAEYNYVASGHLDSLRIRMLNGKSLRFIGDGQYRFGNVDVITPNQPNSNGILHIVDKAIRFYPNLYEYLSLAPDIDLLRSYIKKYELTELDLSNSEKGPIVNGVQTYIDSVLVTSNTMLGRNGLNAQIQNEDSSYTFLMPTDKAYQEYHDRISSLYNYIETTTAQTPATFDKASDTKSDNVTVNATYLRDSLTRLLVVQDLIYSHSYNYNRGLIDHNTAVDTLYSTQRSKLSNPQDIFSQTVGQPVEMSNGYARIVDSLAFHPWETYNPQITSLLTRNMLNAFNHNATLVHYTNPRGNILGPEYTEFYYGLLEPKVADSSKPEFFISLPNVLSGKYKVYCVVLPAICGKTGVNLPTAMNFQLRYCDAKNKLQTYNFCADPADPAHQADSTGTKQENPKTLNMKTAFVNDTTLKYKADTIALGEFTFPICYKGLGNSNIAPFIHVSSPLSVFNKTQMANYSREFRIWAIILRPVDYDEYLNQNNTNNNE